MAHWAISGRRVWASLCLLCPFPSVSHLLNHSHTFPHFPSDQRHHWKSGFLTNRLCPACISRLYIFTGQSLPCLEVVRPKRFIYGVIYEFTKWQSDEGAVFTLVPFYMEITNMAFLFKSGTRTIEVKSSRGPRWCMTPLFFWSDQGLSRISRYSTPQLSWRNHMRVRVWSSLSYLSIQRTGYTLSPSSLLKGSELPQWQLSLLAFLSLQNGTVQTLYTGQ